MTGILNVEQEKDVLLRGFTRRSFFRLAAMVAGASTMPFYDEPAMAQLSKISTSPRCGHDQRQRESARPVP